jgi:aminomethyltransferase
MPLEFPGGGVLKEHNAVRDVVGLFDVSHLGKVSVRGPGAADFVNACLTNDLRRIAPGRAQYTFCCDDRSGGIVDDLIGYLFSADEVFLIPNAANAAAVVRLLAAAAPADVSVRDEHQDYAVLAVQGPRSAQVLHRLQLPADLDYMSFTTAQYRGQPLTVCRSGYTGEHGYELLPRSADAEAVWTDALAVVRELGGQPCGLGARDTLRTEMGYPLHGQDISLEVTPVQARASWAVGWDKSAFWGRAALVNERTSGARRSLRGLLAQDRGIPRPGMLVTREGQRVGSVTSGTFSPTRRIGIALALLDAGVVEGDEVQVDVRGRAATMQVTRPPFVDRSPY